MDIIFESERIRLRFTVERTMRKVHGAERTRRVRRRLDQLVSVETLEVMRNMPGRCHELSGDLKGQLSVDLDGPYRLVFEPADDPVPTKDDGGLDWTRVRTIRVLGVEDTHV